MLPGGQDHPAEPRVGRQPGELLAYVARPRGADPRGRPPIAASRRTPASAGTRLRRVPPRRRMLPSARAEGPQFLQQPDAVRDVARVRRVDEREVGHVTQVERGHPQDDRGQVGAQDLRVGERGPGGEVLLGVQPDAHAVRGPAAAARALAGRCLRDPLDGQPLHLGAVAVPGDPGGTRIYHVMDARDGQRGLRDVGGQHHPAAQPGVGEPARLEHPVLLGRGQPGVQRQHVQVVLAGQRVGGVPDLPLAAEEHQDVARPVPLQLGYRVQDALHLVPRFALRVVRVGQRPVPDLDRVRPPGHLQHRCSIALLAFFASGALLVCFGSAKSVPEPLRVDGGRGDDDLEIGAARQQPLEVAQDEVDVQAALVCLVDDQRVVTAEQAVALQLGKQDAVGHHLDQRAVAGRVVEPHLVADRGAQLGAEFGGDPLGHAAGGDPPRLGVPDLPGHPAAQLQADLGQLGGLARSRLPGDDHHLVVPDGRGYLVLDLADRQLGGIGDDRGQGTPSLGTRGGARRDRRGGHWFSNAFQVWLLPRRSRPWASIRWSIRARMSRRMAWRTRIC